MSHLRSVDRRTGDKETPRDPEPRGATTTTLFAPTSTADRAFGGTHRDDLLDELSPRELEVLTLMADGRSNRATGEQLTVRLETVESHVSRVFTKPGLNEDQHENRCGGLSVPGPGQATAPSERQYELMAPLVLINQIIGPIRMKIPGKYHRPVAADTGLRMPRSSYKLPTSLGVM
jgi:DNA-binding CsgD family transcriptional regulator